jgi:hypothetical protein
MKTHTIRQILITAITAVLMIDVGSVVVALCKWNSVSFPFIAVLATTVMIGTILLQLVAVILQTFPTGRTPVNLPVIGPDAWLFLVVSTALPGVFWHVIAAEAIPVMRLVMPGYATPLLFAVLLQAGRMLQQRRMEFS